MLVLLLESNAKPLKRALEKQGFRVDTAATGAEADRKVRAGDPAIVVLERELLNGDGLAVIQRWRAAGIQAHVLVLTPHGGLQEKLDAFSVGADDCMMKPYQLDDMAARLGAVNRRGEKLQTETVTVCDLVIDISARTVKRGGMSIDLTPREFDLLEFLAANRGKSVSRTMIWQHLYDDNGKSRSNVVDVYIRYLRKKIDAGFKPPLILTCWGEGYMMRSSAEAS